MKVFGRTYVTKQEKEERKKKVLGSASFSNELLCVADGCDRPYEVIDSCDQCEFCITYDAGGTIGGQLFGSRGNARYCEKGYWKDDT